MINLLLALLPLGLHAQWTTERVSGIDEEPFYQVKYNEPHKTVTEVIAIPDVITETVWSTPRTRTEIVTETIPLRYPTTATETVLAEATPVIYAVPDVTAYLWDCAHPHDQKYHTTVVETITGKAARIYCRPADAVTHYVTDKDVTVFASEDEATEPAATPTPNPHIQRTKYLMPVTVVVTPTATSEPSEPCAKDDASAQEKRPAASETKSTRKEKSTTSRHSSTTSKDKPTRASNKTTSTKEKPTSSTEKTTSTREKTTSTEKKPTSTQEKTTSTKEKPTLTEEQTTSTKEKASSTKEKASTTKEKPTTSKVKSTTSKKHPTLSTVKSSTTSTAQEHKGPSKNDAKEDFAFGPAHGTSPSSPSSPKHTSNEKPLQKSNEADEENSSSAAAGASSSAPRRSVNQSGRPAAGAAGAAGGRQAPTLPRSLSSALPLPWSTRVPYARPSTYPTSSWIAQSTSSLPAGGWSSSSSWPASAQPSASSSWPVSGWPSSSWQIVPTGQSSAIPSWNAPPYPMTNSSHPPIGPTGGYLEPTETSSWSAPKPTGYLPPQTPISSGVWPTGYPVPPYGHSTGYPGVPQSPPVSCITASYTWSSPVVATPTCTVEWPWPCDRTARTTMSTWCSSTTHEITPTQTYCPPTYVTSTWTASSTITDHGCSACKASPSVYVTSKETCKTYTVPESSSWVYSPPPTTSFIESGTTTHWAPPKFTSSTVYGTTVATTCDCPPETTSCPAESTVFTTESVPVRTTLCPVTTDMPIPTMPILPPQPKPVWHNTTKPEWKHTNKTAPTIPEPRLEVSETTFTAPEAPQPTPVSEEPQSSTPAESAYGAPPAPPAPAKPSRTHKHISAEAEPKLPRPHATGSKETETPAPPAEVGEAQPFSKNAALLYLLLVPVAAVQFF